ncbi:MAG TPA: EAL domain-containing protein [Rhodoferax sp.]|nr:EAL domain-containing protein [Rhodoferax sp.]HNV59331.1 EAL domain-containing protein [Rhodoferax sp.]HPW29354.1 EAL domain-containing protein [Rhodoferax sp.]
MPILPEPRPEYRCPKEQKDEPCARLDALSDGFCTLEQQHMANMAALREAAQHALAILDNLLDGVVTISEQGLIESFNKAASQIFGYTAAESIGRKASMLMPAELAAQHDARLQHHDRTRSSFVIGQSIETVGQRKDASVFPISLSVSQVERAGETIFVAVIRDITQQRLAKEEIQRLAFYDPLTHLPNRRLLQDRLEQALITSTRTAQQGALMFLDLDHFKHLNDTMGHDLGDELLKQVASRLKTCVREGDTVARLGGDEFVVLLEGLSPASHESAAQAETIAGKVLSALGQSYQLRGHPFESTPSIGIVLFPGEDDNTEALLKKADVAMYQAKAAGRNTVRFFDPAMQAAVTAHAALERDMRRGLARQEFILLYQFQVNVQGVPIGAEAFLRWNHSSRGVVPPSQFITLAEETSVGHLLGQWVLDTACAQLAVWADQEATAHWTLAINVSPSQFGHAGFVGQVAAALHKTGTKPQQLRLELTERMLMNDTSETRNRMHAIKALGVGFSLDDFGTGYSSLAHLQRLPLDQLKIDQSFVQTLLTQPGDAAVARSVIALGHSLGLTVIAEGVETAEQRNLLAELGCDAFQGYYFGRPSLANELAPSQ